MTLSPSDARFLVERVRRISGITLEDADSDFLEQRLAQLLRALRLDSPAALVAALEDASDDSTLVDRVVHALATHDTRFFRNPEVFSALEQQVLPDLLRPLPHDAGIAAWCAGCSTGQEAYSLAIAALDITPRGREPRLEILGTDLSEEAVAQAHSGVFSQYEVTRGLPDAKLGRYFRRDERHWRALPRLRAPLRFERHNLCADPPPGRFHIVFCRNVLMYFDARTRASTLHRLHDALLPEGLLFLGVDESPAGAEDRFEPVASGGTRLAYRPIAAPLRKAA